jgi:NDP-sugar pyrophosphorylase family protein
MIKKYELTKDTIVHEGVELYRIRALRDFGCVTKGDLGGFIEKEANLSQKGNCWVLDDAKVYNRARVSDNALIFGNSWVFHEATCSGNSGIFDGCRIGGNEEVCCDERRGG